MFDIFKRFFGEGKVRVQFQDLATDEVFVAKVPYIGKYDEDALISHVRESLFVENGIRAFNIKVLGHITY